MESEHVQLENVKLQIAQREEVHDADLGNALASSLLAAGTFFLFLWVHPPPGIDRFLLSGGVNVL